MNDLTKTRDKASPGQGKAHIVQVVLPKHLYDIVESEARRLTVPVSTAVRLWLAERFRDHLES